MLKVGVHALKLAERPDISVQLDTYQQDGQVGDRVELNVTSDY